MSRKSNDWAWSQKLKPSMKLTLLTLADRTDENHECWPSQERMVKDTSLNIKTIKLCLKKLMEMGIIVDTGKRKGRTKSVVVYRFTFQNNGENKIAQKRTRTKNGLPSSKPKIGLSSKPKNGLTKQAQNRATEPPSLLNHPIEPPNNPRHVETVQVKSKDPKSKATWLAYANAYSHRYGHNPVRNAPINSMLCKLVDNVGANDAPQIASYYLTLNDRWYQQKYHDVGTLLQNAQAIRTQWLNNTNITSIDHRDIERKTNNFNAHQSVINKIQNGEI